MEHRSTTWLGALASPSLVSNFLRLALGAVAGTVGSAVVGHFFDTDVQVLAASVAAEQTRASADEVVRLRDALTEDGKAIQRAGAAVKQHHEPLRPGMSVIEAASQAELDGTQQVVQTCKAAVAKAKTAAKAAHAATFVSDAKAAVAEAEKARDEAENAKDKLTEIQSGESIFRGISEMMAEGVDLGGIAAHVKLVADENRAKTSAAATEVAGKLTALKATTDLEEAHMLADEIDASSNDAGEAAYDSEKLGKVVTVLRAVDDADEKKPHAAAIEAAAAVVAAANQEIVESAKKLSVSNAEAKVAVTKLSEQQGIATDSTETAAAAAGNSSFFVVLGFFAWLVGRRASRDGWRKDEERVRALPFRLADYEKVLRTTPPQLRTVQVRIGFSGVTPPLDEVRQRVAAFDAKATVTEEGGALLVTRTGMQTMLARVNHMTHQWVHQLVNSTLLPLHATTPIASVGLSAIGATSAAAFDEGDQDDDSDDE